MAGGSSTYPYAAPPNRRLRIYAFDPSVGTDLATAAINEAVVKVPWEADLEAGPVGEYFEVIDVDPASGTVYRPVDLNDPCLLAQDGLTPSEGNPMFHQQMVYAVAMTTVGHFEKALGRKILWSPRGQDAGFAPVSRLRIYPHALREANAYYSPGKKALLFGYFPASLETPGRNLPGGMVFTCLSNDVVAHETTHAVVDGLHPRYIEPSNPDAPAFHEAFADIVALFQHFTMPEALSHQIARMRGDLGQRTLLSELAVQFGQAIGQYGALRSAIDTEAGNNAPDPTLYARTIEPHARGAILVAAVFDGFLGIYRNRIADLLRLVTGDSAKFPDQDLHPDLAARLTAEANKVATHVLRMCIRALDYMPPVDPTFGEFLRALITADADLVADDTRSYRVSMIEAFRRRGIYPADCRSLAADSLLWNAPHNAPQLTFLKGLDLRYLQDRGALARQSAGNARRIHDWLMKLSGHAGRGAKSRPSSQGLLQLAEMGLALGPGTPATVRRRNGVPVVEVHSVRLARRTGPNQESLTQIVVEITQRRAGYFSPADQEKADAAFGDDPDPGDFAFRGGCTLVIEPGVGDEALGGEVRYCVRKRIDDAARLARHRAYLLGDPLAAENAYRSNRVKGEPFALLHRCAGGGNHGF